MSESKKLGIELNMDGMQLSDDTGNRKKLYDILQFILIYFATYSTLNCFSSGIELPVQMNKLNIVTFFFCMVDFVIVTYIKAYKKVLIVLGSSFVAICIFYREIIADGMKVILNRYLLLYEKYYLGESSYHSFTIADIQAIILIGMIMLTILFFVVYVKFLMKNKKNICYSLLLLPFVCFYVYLSLYDEYYRGGSRFRALTTKEMESALLVAMMVLAALLSVAYTRFIIKGQKSSSYSLLSVPFVFCSFVVGMIPDLIPFLLYCATSFVVFGSSTVPNGYAGKKKGEARAVPSSIIRIKQGSIVFFISCSFLALATIFFTDETYKKIDLLDKKESLQMELKRISTSELLKGTIFETMWGTKREFSRGGLSNGIIGSSNGIKFSNTTELKVTSSGEQTEEVIYLRGYIGQQYSQNKWDCLSKKSQEQLLNLKNRYSIETLDVVMANLLQLISQWTGQQNKTQKISVQNVGAERDYFYVPYHQKGVAFVNSNGFFQVPTCNAFEPIDYEAEEPLKGTDIVLLYEQIKEQNERNIKKIEAWLGCPIEEYKTQHISQRAKQSMDQIVTVLYLEDGKIQVCDISDEEKPYLLTEAEGEYTYKDYIEDTIKIRNEFTFIKEYETFVYETYVALPDQQLELVKALVDDWKAQEIKGNNQSEEFYNHCILKIKDYFKENTSYTLNPGAVPEGKEVVDYFLFENPNGYCMYYATAAVVMLREFGIPARYVEGFLATQADFMNGVSENGEQIANIKDSNAHAWVEVYKKGVGWVPIEVTPSYESDGVIQIPPENKDSTMSANPLKPPQNPPSVSKAPIKKPTKAPTKAPSVSNKPQSQMTKDKEKTDNAVISILQVTLYIIGILLMIAAILMVIRIFINQRRRNMMMLENTSKKAILQYRILQKLFIHRNIVYKEKEPFTLYAKEIQKQFPCFTEEECQKYIYLILKARYHYGWLTKEEGAFTTSFYERLVSEFYQNIGKCRRLYYHYIKFF